MVMMQRFSADNDSILFIRDRMKGHYLQGVLLIVVGVLLFLAIRNPYTIPKHIWTHWNTSPAPDEIQELVKRMQKKHPDWQVHFLTTETFLKTVYPSEIPPGFREMSVEHQSDWIRLKALSKYGGCWMDSGILINESIDSLRDECIVNRADLLAFEIKGKQTNMKYPIAENWFIMAPPDSVVIHLWLEEYERAIRYGFQLYKEQILAEGVDLQSLMKDKYDTYLTEHGCFQKVIQQRVPPGTKILYHTAEDSMFKLQAGLCNWDQECIWKKLKEKDVCRSIPYLKLRGVDRKNANILHLLSD